MRVREDNVKEYMYSREDEVESLEYDEKVFIIVDPSKTNMAVGVGTEYNDFVRIYEFSGKGQDTTDYCEEFKVFFRKAFKNLNIYDMSIEQAILKKDGKDTGYKYFQSNMVLTEVRGALLSIIKEMTGRKADEINNQTWKTDILPEGYNKQHEKGSKTYLMAINDKYGNWTDDVTDMVCMYRHKLKEYMKLKTIYCDKIESLKKAIDLKIMFTSFDKLPKDIKFFKFNNEFSIRENAIYFSNRCSLVGVAEIHPDNIPIEEMYNHTYNISTKDTPYLVILR